MTYQPDHLLFHRFKEYVDFTSDPATLFWSCELRLPRTPQRSTKLYNMIQAKAIAEMQTRWTADWHQVDKDPEGLDPLWSYIHGNHRRNFNLWHEEDCARRDDMGFEYVYRAKRAIDAYNQQRNDFIERIDQWLFENLKPDTAGAPVNSETPGMIIDRLSIMALKHFHMIEQTERSDVDEAHLEKCRQKVEVLRQQRADLTEILEQFLTEISEGKRAFRVYFQFKMYNDPSLNPQLYRKSES